MNIFDLTPSVQTRFSIRKGLSFHKIEVIGLWLTARASSSGLTIQSHEPLNDFFFFVTTKTGIFCYCFKIFILSLNDFIFLKCAIFVMVIALI